MPRNYTVYDIQDNTMQDLQALGYVVKVVDQYYTPIGSERMIAMRTTTSGGLDFHFMAQRADGTWTHKPGNSPVLTLNGNPWDTPWVNESAIMYADLSGFDWRASDIEYDSDILYLVYS